MKRKFLYLLLTLCLLGQCLPAFAAQAPVLERIAFSGATIVGQFKSNVYQYQLVLDSAMTPAPPNIPLLTRTPQLMLRTARTTWTRSPAPWVSWCRR